MYKRGEVSKTRRPYQHVSQQCAVHIQAGTCTSVRVCQEHLPKQDIGQMCTGWLFECDQDNACDWSSALCTISKAVHVGGRQGADRRGSFWALCTPWRLTQPPRTSCFMLQPSPQDLTLTWYIGEEDGACCNARTL